MRLKELIDELHGMHFESYFEMLKWTIDEAKAKSCFGYTHSQERNIIRLLQELRDHVGYPCAFGDNFLPHARDDECFYCHKSICKEHCGKRLIFDGISFSICVNDLDKMDEVNIKNVAKEIMTTQQ